MEGQIELIIVDDDQGMRDTLADILEDEGYQVTTTAKGLKAVEEIKEKFFNVALIDLNLPDINGLELVTIIKKIDPRISIIIITAYGTIKTAVEALKKGAYDYITKPFQPEEMVITIKKVLEIQRLSIESRQLKETITALAKIIEAKDPYTHGHSDWVSEYSVSIAQRLGLSALEVDNIREAGQLHDIGMVGVSERILRKRSELTEDDYEQIKLHPLIGIKILAPANSLSKIIPLVYHHHERYDGSGYPLGIKSNEIPLGARILAVADFFQAMISPRHYRQAHAKEEVIQQLKAESGTKFDPQVVDAFLDVLIKR